MSASLTEYKGHARRYFRYREHNIYNHAPIIGAGYVSAESCAERAEAHAEYLRRNGTGSVTEVTVEQYWPHGPYREASATHRFNAVRVLC